MKNNIVRPIAFMVSLEPVRIKKNPKGFLSGAQYKDIIEDADFELAFGCHKRHKLYEMTYLVTARRNDWELPTTIVRQFDSVDRPEAKDFIYYPMKMFKSFPRAILSFEDRPYIKEDYERIMQEWIDELLQIAK